MSAPTVTEREAVLRERAAWVACDMEFAKEGYPRSASERLAAERYPLPKVTRPRVTTRDIGGTTVLFRVVNRRLESQVARGDCCPHDIRWCPVDGMIITELEACSTEEVDDEGTP